MRSLFSLPLIADTTARLMAWAVKPTPKKALRFPEIKVRTRMAVVPTRHGDVPAMIYHPIATYDPPVYINLHGGGFVIGHPEQDDPLCRYLAAYADVVVINPDYALAPQRRFPTQPEQIYDVVQWAAAHPDWDGRRLCLGGQSAGGNLAAAAARLALHSGGPAIALQVLHYPTLDLATPMRDKPSRAGRRTVLRPWMGEVFDTAYLPDPARRRDPLASVVLETNTENLRGIAPALVIAAEFDRLCDEARRYADKLRSVEALVEYFEVCGVDHGYNIRSNAVEPTRQVYELIATHVRRATATGSDPGSVSRADTRTSAVSLEGPSNWRRLGNYRL